MQQPATRYRTFWQAVLWKAVRLLVCCGLWQRAAATQGKTLRIDTATLASYYHNAVQDNRSLVQFIEFTLAQRQLPDWFSNLALIESGFDPAAVSEMGAAGIWQLMPGTAADYGLPDEHRFDAYKSTLIAVKVISGLYRNYKDPLLVVAAYSCGAGCVNSAMTKAGSKAYSRVKRFLPAESVLHVEKFVLACRATGKELPQEQEPCNVPAQPPPGMLATDVGSGYQLSVIAGLLGMDLAALTKLNSNWERQLADSGKALLVLPTDKMPDFLLLQNEMLNRSMQNQP